MPGWRPSRFLVFTFRQTGRFEEIPVHFGSVISNLATLFSNHLFIFIFHPQFHGGK